ncbi:hypothetical protein Tco_1236330 [Tanacetum coccineum]
MHTLASNQLKFQKTNSRKTYDIGSFIKWFCKRTGKKKLYKADLEGPAFNLAKAFHKNSVFLQYQMDRFISCRQIKVDWRYLKDGDGDGNSQFLRCQVNNRMLIHDLHLLSMYERPHKGVKASANSDVKYSFTSAQDGESL